MKLNEFIQVLKRKKQTIAVIMFFAMTITFIITVIPVFEYRTDSRFLVKQKDLVDPYAITKANEYYVSLFSEILISDSFFRDVFNSSFNIDKSYFLSLTDKDKRALWKNSIEVENIKNSGVFKISVFHDDKNQSREIAKAINSILAENHKNYYTDKVDLSLELLAGPDVSNFPVRPNFLFNFGLGFILGIILSFSYICFFPESSYDLRFFPKRKNEIKILDLDENDSESVRISFL